MMASRKLACAVVWLVLASTPTAVAEDVAINEVEDALPSAQEVEQHLLASAKIMRQHGGEASKVFASYNRFIDTKKSDGVQTLGNQEVRALLKDVGIGNVALRGAIAEIATLLLDSSGDSRVSEGELAAGLGLLSCWVDLTASDDAAVLAPLRRVDEKFQALQRSGLSANAVAALVAEEYHGVCSDGVAAWWASGWARRLSAFEKGIVAALSELSNDSVEVCASRLVDRLLSQSTTDEELKHKKDQPGQRAVRTALKLAGLNSIFARHAAATAIVAALDADRDGKLAREEMADASVAICRVHKALSARATSFTALARGLSTAAPAGYPPVSFLTDLASSRAADAIGDSARLESARAAARAADLSDAQVVTAEMAIAMAEAYVRLVPADVLPRQDEEGKGKTEL